MGKDYYAILGVDKGANDAELKKGKYCLEHLQSSTTDVDPNAFMRFFAAYRKLAIQHHPVRPVHYFAQLHSMFCAGGSSYGCSALPLSDKPYISV